MISTNRPFDDRADAYDAYRTGYSRTLYETLLELGFTPGWHVLDVACGTALASEPLSQRGFRITGVDVSERMLEKARARISQAEFVRGEAEALPFERGEFDAAICAQAIHWMDKGKAVAEMARVVRPGGRVAVWWKTLVPEEPIRLLRAAAAEAVGKTAPPDIMEGSFRAFYQHPFAERWLRVVPYVVMTTTDRWIGYEKSRARLEHYGERAQDYLVELERRMREIDRDKPFRVNYSQFLYVAQV